MTLPSRAHAFATRSRGPPVTPADDAPPTFALIAAVARNGVIGADNALPWRLPDDLKRFRALTTGHAVIMGRKTWESLPRALPERQNIVVTRAAALCRRRGATSRVRSTRRSRRPRCRRPSSASAAASSIASRCRCADALYLTEIARDFDGDASFPAFDRRIWRETAREAHAGESPDGFAYAFVTYRALRWRAHDPVGQVPA